MQFIKATPLGWLLIFLKNTYGRGDWVYKKNRSSGFLSKKEDRNIFFK